MGVNKRGLRSQEEIRIAAERAAGRMCRYCTTVLDPGAWGGNVRVCDACGAKGRQRHVYLRFARDSDGWVVQILDEDLVTPCGRTRHFTSFGKIEELIGRTETAMNLETRQALGLAMTSGKGGLRITLTQEQYDAWRLDRKPPSRADPPR